MIIGQHHRVGLVLSNVVRFQRTQDGKKVMCYTRDGEFETFGEGEFEGALRSTIQATFPADGLQWLQTIYDDKRKPIDVEARSVLGLALDATGELLVITMDGNYPEPVLLFPDGHVEAFENSWPTLTAYKQVLVSDAAAAPALVLS
jgi:hypothetical protein